MTVWLATGNAHKKAELAAILRSDKTLRIPSDAGIAFDPAENGSTFAENALIKAEALWSIVKEPVIADDSGLCVDALGGRPGIYSARYAGPAKDGGGKKIGAAERNALLLGELDGAAERSARFVCAMALVYGEGRFFIVQETLEGEIALPEQAAGTGGFGYDPVFFLPERRCTLAELDAGEKNALSHRGKAGRIIAGFLGALPAGL
ncbi:MAG: RdgB/HAM1 family non-canonical purine NTP pyrophosphatase [Treponema sp.]|jgi:XTP/dITP diphosphohydrolase|nr:RdgB/HAM1 family non-canonical purine NTP pyrophosphatase [Treponema sp.]